MAVVRCEDGHYYDNVKFKECPHCKNGLNHVKKEDYVDDIEKLKTKMQCSRPLEDVNEEATVSLEAFSSKKPEEEKTVGFYNFEDGTEFVTGWLVCVKGPARGRDYRLFHGWNRIGRGSDMDVYIPEDAKLSSAKQAAVVFDDKEEKFYLVNEEGSLTYLNDRHSTGSVELRSGDCISMGDTKLIFIAFCTEERRWENYD